MDAGPFALYSDRFYSQICELPVMILLWYHINLRNHSKFNFGLGTGSNTIMFQV
jgi:hypothetical protein